MSLRDLSSFQNWAAAAMIGLLTLCGSMQAAKAGGQGLPLADLAGPFSGHGGGVRTLCFCGTSLAPCSNSSSVAVPFNDAEVLQGTRDVNGRFCFAVTDVVSPVPGSQLPAVVSDFVAVGSTTSYNPETGRGSVALTLYNAGGGVGCNGSILVNPSKAAAIATGTQDFAVGQNPAVHFDLVVTSLTDTAGVYGGAALSSSLLIQGQYY